MAAKEIHVGDIGTILELPIVDDGAIVNFVTDVPTTIEVFIARPKVGALPKDTLTKIGTIQNPPGSDGIVEYVAILNDWDRSGVFRVQAHLIFTGGSNLKSEIKDFEVHSNLA